MANKNENIIVKCRGKLLLQTLNDEYHLPKEICQLNSFSNSFSYHDWNAIELEKEIDIPSHVWIELRKSAELLSKEEYRQAVEAFEFLYWNATTRHCSVCGEKLQINFQISKKCQTCGNEVWPHLAPAIIVLVKKDDKILLVRNKNFKGDFYGLVAGFVEVGETLEDTVRREIREETSLEVDNIKYISSQSWPFPSQLMIGFTAEYKSGELNFADGELIEGEFFYRENLPSIPSPVSIARTLIELWKENKI